MTEDRARRRFKTAAFLLLASLLACLGLRGGATAAEKFPSHPINIVVPWAPGGLADVSGRIIGAKLSEILGVPVIIVNKPGATGTIGTQFVKTASADGYTLLAPTNTPLSQVPASNPNLAYTLSDFAVIGCFVSDPTVIVAKKSAAWNNFDDFISGVRKNPGKYNSGDGGFGGAGYLAMEIVKDAYGLNVVPVHFKGSGDLKVAILGGVVDIASGNLSVLSSLVNSNDVTGLVVMAPRRSEIIPKVPTIKEKGFPNASLVLSNGLFAPSGTPPEALETLSRALAKAMQDPAVNAQIKKAGLIPDYYDGPTYTAMLRQELTTIKAVVEKAGNAK